MPCIVDVYDVEKIGKTAESKPFNFDMPRSEPGASSYGTERRRAAIRVGERLCPEGWEMNTSFSSKKTFGQKTVGGKEVVTCHTTIHRWVWKCYGCGKELEESIDDPLCEMCAEAGFSLGPDCTCYKCDYNGACDYAWDPYNKDGDCLRDK